MPSVAEAHPFSPAGIAQRPEQALATTSVAVPDEANHVGSVTSPAGLFYDVYNSSTALHTFMDVAIGDRLLCTFAGYGLAVQAIKDGELDELVQPTGSSPACAAEDPELFYPITEVGEAARRQIEAAKAVCQRCPLLQECRAGALARHEEFGVWGGLSEKERRALKRAAARQEVAA